MKTNEKTKPQGELKIRQQLGGFMKTELYMATPRGNEEFFASTASDMRTIDEQQGNAEKIARAVNSHETLQNSLEELMQEVEKECSLGSDPRMMGMLRKWQKAYQALENSGREYMRCGEAINKDAK